MENKSLGRGFKEISNIFISKDNKGKTSPDTKNGEPKQSNRNPADDPLQAFQTPFTMVHHRYGDCGKEKADTDLGKMVAQLESTLSSIMNNSDECATLVETMCEVEENVTVEKNIAYPSMPDSRHNIIKALCSHLEGGFHIKSIELEKTDTKNRPGKKTRKTEKVTIFLEEPPALAEL